MKAVGGVSPPLRSPQRQQEVSLRSVKPSVSSVSRQQREGGVRGACPDSEPRQPPSSDSQRGFSHSRPV